MRIRPQPNAKDMNNTVKYYLYIANKLTRNKVEPLAASVMRNTRVLSSAQECQRQKSDNNSKQWQ